MNQTARVRCCKGCQALREQVSAHRRSIVRLTRQVDGLAQKLEKASGNNRAETPVDLPTALAPANRPERAEPRSAMTPSEFERGHRQLLRAMGVSDDTPIPNDLQSRAKPTVNIAHLKMLVKTYDLFHPLRFVVEEEEEILQYEEYLWKAVVWARLTMWHEVKKEVERRGERV